MSSISEPPQETKVGAPVSTRDDTPLPELPETAGYRLKTRLLGPPLHSGELDEQRLGIPTALAVFSSDCISSSNDIRPCDSI